MHYAISSFLYCDASLHCDFDFCEGLYNFILLPTRAGPVTICTGLAYPGGLQATYYQDDSFSIPFAGRTDAGVDFAIPPWPGTNVPAAPPGAMYSIAWSGLVRTKFNQIYTFSAVLLDTGASITSASCSGRVALWIDNALVLSQWDSLASLQPSGTFLLSRPDGLYTIDLQYKSMATSFAAGGPGAFRLFWQTNWRGRIIQKGAVPMGLLYWTVPAGNIPVRAMVIAAAAIVGATSLQGSYAGALTASDQDGGTSVNLNASLTLRDPFGNPALPPPANILAVRIRSVATLVEVIPSLVYAGGSTFQISYTLNPAALFTRALFIVQAAAIGGLNAEYFDDGRLLNRVMCLLQNNSNLVHHNSYTLRILFESKHSSVKAHTFIHLNIERACMLLSTD